MPIAPESRIPIRAYVDAVNTELDRRTRHHQALIARHRSTGSFDKERPPVVLLANGDSWFDYPLGGTVPFVDCTDIIAQLTGGLGLEQPPIILDLAVAGDTTLQSMGLDRQQRIEDAVNDPKNGKFEGILYSGGGDDIAGDQFLLWLRRLTDPNVNGDQSMGYNALEARFETCLDLIEGVYDALVDQRKNLSLDVPIFIHNYDFPVPNGVRACPGIGPWLSPGFAHQGWPVGTDKKSQATIIISYALLRFAERLSNFQGRHNDVVYIQTQGTIKDQAHGWDNELHPKPEGFKLIAGKFLFVLQQTFKGRIY
jgi:hypothetical protein